jgi:hypothetical protein
MKTRLEEPDADDRGIGRGFVGTRGRSERAPAVTIARRPKERAGSAS